MKRQLQFFDTAERLNRVRLARAQAIFSPLQQQLFSLIPVFVHCHHPSLPGYNHPLTPCGIAQFDPQLEHTNALARLNLAFIAPTSAPMQIEGVYVMGSTASFGQNPKSDVDVWLVHSADISATQQQLLRDKAKQLTRWFAGFDFEVNFYLLQPEHFKWHQQQHATTEWEVLGHENSGSAQHWLLLDEFYRSHIRLAGKPAVWWPEGVADPERLLYLGDMRELPASEYFGASLWQLYKGLEKPHKALLKVLLLEAYASEYPQTRLVSEEIWHLTEQENFTTENDPYLQLYFTIERYLLKVGDLRRLEIARRCFYLKCGIRLSDAHTHQDWRFHYLRKLVRDWEWPYSLVATLDNCHQWHSGELQWFNEQLNQLMLTSYQTLLRFASTQRLSESFKVEDLGLLTRKLHTYFSEDKQQILRLNSLWSQSIAEPHLTILHSENQQCYYLYRLTPDPKKFIGEVAIYRAESIAALLAWTCLNGVADENTQWHLFGANRRRSRRLSRVAHRILPSLANCDWRVSKLELCQPWHYRKIILLLNLEDDPSQLWQGQEIMVDLLGINPLSVGKSHFSLMGSLQLLTQNSWGEWHSYNFSAELGLLELIQHIAAGLKRTPTPIAVEVLSASAKARPQLESHLRQLLRQIVTLIHRADNARTLVQPLQLRHKRYGVFFDGKGVSYRDLSDVRSLYQQMMRGALNEPELRDKPLPRFEALPQPIQDVAVKGVVQYFLRPNDTQVDVYVLDELNQLQHYIQNSNNINELVSQVSQHFAFADVHNLRGRFNFPQFFLLQGSRQALQVVPFGMSSAAAQSDF
ncbi:adenylate cyclase [Shewanella mangrovi]|uniref:Adenylate cyclase n=1 Tax=Shewanella mangrovi TaxID=1515746 RepID=A0A094JI72_9GAMM|nr:adenylate cyclase [Shewanella mangrovi]